MLRVARDFVVTEVMPGSERFEVLLDLAESVLAQARYVVSEVPTAFDSHVLGAFDGSGCVGFLRYIVQVIRSRRGTTADCSRRRCVDRGLRGGVRCYARRPA